MGDSDVYGLKDDVKKLDMKIDTVFDAIADLRVLVAGEYIRKDDFYVCRKTCEDRIIRVYDKVEEHKKEEAANRWKLAGLTASFVAVFLTAARWIFDLFTGGKN